MVLSELKQKGVFTKVYEIGAFFDVEPEAVTVKLQGPNTEQIIRMSSAENEERRGHILLDMLKELMIDHNIDTEPGKAATVDEVVELIKNMPACHTFLVQKLMREVTDLMQARSGSSETLPG